MATANALVFGLEFYKWVSEKVILKTSGARDLSDVSVAFLPSPHECILRSTICAPSTRQKVQVADRSSRATYINIHTLISPLNLLTSCWTYEVCFNLAAQILFVAFLFQIHRFECGDRDVYVSLPSRFSMQHKSLDIYFGVSVIVRTTLPVILTFIATGLLVSFIQHRNRVRKDMLSEGV